MPKFQTTRRVSHSPDHMYALVADVEKYPEFLPLCKALNVHSRRKHDSREILVADMTVGYKAMRETFTTQVLLTPEENSIGVKYLDGPFRYLTNEWKFVAAGRSGSEVKFFIDYEFKSSILSAIMGTMFERSFCMFAEAFEKRADVIYGLAKTV